MIRRPSFLRRSAKPNPFEATTNDGQTAAPANPDGTVEASPEAAAVLGPDVALQLANDVAVEPVLQTVVSATLSGVKPDEVAAGTVSIYGIVLDTSRSALRFWRSMGQAHDEFIAALMPALREDIAILVTCTYLDGTVAYPLTRLENVPRFGRQPVGTVAETVRGRETVRLDQNGHQVAENGLTYDHLYDTWRPYLLDHTPLRDRVKQQITALLAETVEWAARAARNVNVISAVIADGLDTSSTTTPDELRDLTDATEDEGYFTALATFIGDLADPSFRGDLEYGIIGNLMPQDERGWMRSLEERKAKYGHVLPQGHETMSNEQLLRWFFHRQGLAALEDRLFPTGTDPKAIRRAAGQMSQVAYQKSGVAYAAPTAGQDETGSGWPSLPNQNQ